MASLFNKLFGRSRREPAKQAEVVVSAFGKHPGWDDHFEVGIETDCLALVRQAIYVEGIAGNVDAGVWDRLPAGQRVESFDHILLWHEPQGCRDESGAALGDVTIAGRLCASRDGRGRDRYPMVLAAQCSNWPLALVAQTALPALGRAMETARQQKTSGEVMQLVQELRGELRAALPWPPPAGIAPPLPAIGENALLVLAYHLERSVAAEACIHLRVPVAADNIADSSASWDAFIRRVLSQVARPMASQPILFLQSAGSWADLIIGRPQKDDLFCIRANATALPLTTDIPYNLDAEFIARAKPLLAAT